MTNFEKELAKAVGIYRGHIMEGERWDRDLQTCLNAILRAHEADIERIIGPDEPAVFESTIGDMGGPNYGGITRNHLRAEQRSRAKLPEEGSKK